MNFILINPFAADLKAEGSLNFAMSSNEITCKERVSAETHRCSS
jgi:hypothetical protein